MVKSALEAESKPPAVGELSMLTPVSSKVILGFDLRSGLPSPLNNALLLFVAANFAVAVDCACSNLLMVGCRFILYEILGSSLLVPVFCEDSFLLVAQPMIWAGVEGH